ncbi:hypothetical protein RRG08_066144 [Elysia crispata]|uniref:Uncharacterized protein n=1 Tax=Elysia crispata TaxID=231223 RepID=A0AAE1ECC3_9GAST|nr:hypothetical protein RRG08_066144 [Elysia crispata]
MFRSQQACKTKSWTEHVRCVCYSYTCTHAGSFKTAGNGKRETKSNKQGCRAKISACLDRNDKAKIIVK